MSAFFGKKARPWIFALVALFVLTAVVSSIPDVQSESAESLYSKAVGKYIEGQYSESYQLLEKVLEKDPDHGAANRLLPEVKKEIPSRAGGSSDKASPDQQPSESSRPSGDQTKQKQQSLAQDQQVPTSDFKPLAPSERGNGSMTPPEIDAEPKNVIRHVNEDYTRESSREEAVYGLVARQYEDRVRFTIEATGSVGYIGSRIFNPPMIIVDLPNSVDKLPDSPLPIEMGKILRARHSQYRVDPVRTTRIVFDLEQWSDRYRLYRNPDGGGAVVDVFQADAELPPETPMIHRVDQVRSPDRVSSPTAKLEKIQGDDQKLELNSPAQNELALRLTDPEGEPIAGETVVYSVTRGSGRVEPSGVRGLQGDRTLTDDGGFARATYRSDTVAGVTVVEARVPSRNLKVKYRLKVQPGPATQLVKVSGDRQSTLFGQSVPNPLTVEARDRYGNPVPGVELKFEDLTGKGLLDLYSDSEGIQVRGATNERGRVVVDLYRIASDVQKNKVRVQNSRKRSKELRAVFTVFGQPQLITIDFKSANLQDVLRTMAQIANWNIALPEETPEGNLDQMSVTVHLEKVTALRALDTILDVKGLSRVSDGNVMKIVSKREAIRKGVSVLSPDELSDYPANNIVTVAFKLRFLQANQQLAQQLQNALAAENSSIVADETSNSLIITDLANNLRRIKRVLNTIDRQDQLFEVKVFKLEKRNPEELSQAIQSLLPTGEGNVVPYPETNSLLVYADPSLLDRVKRVIDPLDQENALIDHLSVIDVEGYDAQGLAQQINAILGGNVIPLDQLGFVSFDVEGGGAQSIMDQLSSANEIDIGQLLNSARIIALSDMEKIIVLGPEDVRETAKLLVEKMKRKPGKYIQERSWDWVSFSVMPFEKARSLIQKTGGIKIQTEIERINSFLLSSKDEEELRQVKDFITKVEQKYDEGEPVGVYRLKHLQLTTEELVDDFEESLETLMEGAVPDADFGLVVNGVGQTVSYSTERDKMSTMRSAIASLDTSAYEHSQGKIMTYTPDYRDPQEISNFITQQDLGTVIPGGGNNRVTFIPKEDKSLVLSRLNEIDSTGRSTYSYTLKHMNVNEDVVSRISQIAEQLGINVQFSSAPGTNQVYFTTTENNLDDIKSLLKAFDEPGTSKDRVILNFSPNYVSPENLVDPVDQQNLGQVVYAGDGKITLLVASDRKEKIREILKKIDDPSQTFEVINLDRRKASESLISTVQSVLDDLGVNAQIAADPKTNSILYAAPAGNQDKVAQVIRRLDKWQKQVLIKAVLVEIELSKGQRLNPQWISKPGSSRSPFINENQFNQNVTAAAGYSVGPQGGDLGLSALLNEGDFITILRWIRDHDSSEIVTRPVVTALNNQEASIDLSQQRFFQTVNFDDDGNVVATSFTAQSADKTLEVTPTITEDSNIIMDVRIANDVFGQRPGQQAPFPINRRVTQNQVLVNDGQTIVLGGFIQSNQTERVDGVPYLMDIPYLGNLFKTINNDTVRSELVIFLTPHVMETPQDIKEGTEEAFQGIQQMETPDDLPNPGEESRENSKNQ